MILFLLIFYGYKKYKSYKLKEYNDIITKYTIPVKKLTVIDFNKLASDKRYALTHSLMLTHSLTHSFITATKTSLIRTFPGPRMAVLVVQRIIVTSLFTKYQKEKRFALQGATHHLPGTHSLTHSLIRTDSRTLLLSLTHSLTHSFVLYAVLRVMPQ